MRRLGLSFLVIAFIAAAGAPFLAPHATDTKFSDLLYAPPTIPHIVDDAGAWHAPFIYRWRLADRLEQRFEQDRSAPVPLVRPREG